MYFQIKKPTFFFGILKAVDKDFFSTTIPSDHGTKIFDAEEFEEKYNIDITISKGVPENVASYFLRQKIGQDNIIYFKVRNKGFPLYAPYLEVQATYSGGTETFEKPLDEQRRFDYDATFESYIELPENAENIKIKAGLYKSKKKDFIYREIETSYS